MVIAFERRAMRLDTSFQIEFTWRNARAYTVGQERYQELFERHQEDEEDPADIYLIIDSYCYIEDYDRISEVSAVTRPNILVMLGIISFVTGKALTPFGFYHGIHQVVQSIPEEDAPAVKLLLEDDDYSAALTEMLQAVAALPAGKQTLIYSLLDRWRKATFLDEENVDSFLYEDEAILACFHIFELLGKEYSVPMEKELDAKVKAFTKDVLELFYIGGQEESAKLTKLIDSTLEQHKVKAKPRILRMLQELELLEPKSKALIDRFLDHRNAIAHGRVNLYEDKAIFPLKPFFTHMKDIYEDIETIRIVSARVIAAFLGVSLWSAQWKELLEQELAPYEQVQQFNRQRRYEGLSCDDFERGAADQISVYTLLHYYRKGKLAIQAFTLALSAYIKNVALTEDNAMLLLYVGAILADSTDQATSGRAREILAQLKDSAYDARHEFRNVLKELAFQGREPQWLKALLIERANAARAQLEQ